MERLCKLVKEDIKKRNPSHRSTDKKGFEQQTASIWKRAITITAKKTKPL